MGLVSQQVKPGSDQRPCEGRSATADRVCRPLGRPRGSSSPARNPRRLSVDIGGKSAAGSPDRMTSRFGDQIFVTRPSPFLAPWARGRHNDGPWRWSNRPTAGLKIGDDAAGSLFARGENVPIDSAGWTAAMPLPYRLPAPRCQTELRYPDRCGVTF